MAFDAFDELVGSPVLTVMPTGQRAQRMALIDPDDIDTLIDFIFPLGDFGAAYPGRNPLRASSMRIEPVAPDSQKIVSPGAASLGYATLNAYSKYKVTIDYETLQANTDQGEDPQLLLNHRWSAGGEFLATNAAGWEWEDGGAVDKEVPVGLFIGMFEHQITWSQVENPPFDAIRKRIATVNDATLNFKTGEIAPETLLFIGTELQRDILTDGALAWQLGYHFSERRVQALTIDDSILTELACDAAEGVWNSTTSKCGLVTVGGWNHFYRSEDPRNTTRVVDVQGKNGWYRLRTKPETDSTLTSQSTCTAGGGTWDADLGESGECVVGGRDPVYPLRDFSKLFQEAS